MKKQIQVSIPNTCHKRWSEFEHQLGGRYCTSCNRIVVDFTQMSDDQIFSFFDNSSAKTCGRFFPGQLKTYHQEPLTKIFPGLKLLKAGVLSALVALTFKPSLGQQLKVAKDNIVIAQRNNPSTEGLYEDKMFYKIRGLVIDEYGSPLPGINVILAGSDVGTVTDIDGKFVFPTPLNVGDKLLFAFIGMETKEYIVKHQTTEEIEIKMKMDEYAFMGEVSIDKLYSTKNGTFFSRLWQNVKSKF